MNETMTTQNNITEVGNNRLEKYAERVNAKPQWKNQLLIKDGQAIFVKSGKPYTCKKVEGYVKLPGMLCMEPIEQQNMSICFTPKKRVIISKDGQAYFRGYRELNTEGCILFVHAASSCYDLLVADFSDEIPALITIDDGEVDNVNSLTYRILEFFIKNSMELSDNVATEIGMGKGDAEDEWE